MQAGVFLLSLVAAYEQISSSLKLAHSDINVKEQDQKKKKKETYFDWKILKYGDFDILTKQQWTTKRSLK